MPKLKGQVPPTTMLWLKQYFLTHGEGNPYGFIHYVNELAAEVGPKPGMSKVERLKAETEANWYKQVSYNRVMVIFWMLRKVGAIEKTRTEPSGKGRPRIYYRMSKPEWFIQGLQNYIYPATALGAQKYRGYVERREPPPSISGLKPLKPIPGAENVERGSRYWEEAPRAKLPETYHRKRLPPSEREQARRESRSKLAERLKPKPKS